ncbi:universal stress protein [Glutamicibacter uratoxydans]|uniref:universal stress protein n=1 Tax=Glutamicibacter uratoxydans TaxID=43667 RepID=UPI003D6F5C5B
MSETIIVGVDGSETALKAARRAAELSTKLGAELVVVTAHASDNTEVVSIGSDTWILDDAEQARKLAERVARDVRDAQPEANIIAAAGHGKPAEVLIGEANARNASMIVVGNVGMKGLGRVLGSVASSVAHSAPCDVLVVKTDK